MKSVPYILICLVLPALWGVAVSFVFSKIDAHRKINTDKNESVDMFYI